MAIAISDEVLLDVWPVVPLFFVRVLSTCHESDEPLLLFWSMSEGTNLLLPAETLLEVVAQDALEVWRKLLFRVRKKAH